MYKISYIRTDGVSHLFLDKNLSGNLAPSPRKRGGHFFAPFPAQWIEAEIPQARR
jgi:hypothetical protein